MLFILLFLLLLILLTGFFTLHSLVFGSVDLICVTSQPQAHIFYDLVIFLLSGCKRFPECILKKLCKHFNQFGTISQRLLPPPPSKKVSKFKDFLL